MVGVGLIEVGFVWGRRLALCLVVSMLVSCNGKGGAAGSEGDPPTLSIQEFVRQYTDAYCERVLACCTQGEGQYLADPCIAGDASFFEAATDALSMGAEQGRLLFDEDAAHACVEAVKAMSCQEHADRKPGSGPLSCPSLVKARTAIGDPCVANYECISASCERGYDEDVGVCGPMPGPGEPCGFGNCPAGYFCDDSAPAEDRVCTALLRDGESCSWDGGNHECVSDYCKGGSKDVGDGYCAPPEHNESCNGSG